ncbi:MAG: ABC transporter permease [Ignavibacteria bacterium]|nr:ABC transporter permease [Ignavibacteria bacterium]
MFTRILAIVKKEFRQIIRDKRSLILIFFYPVFMLILFGYALNFDVKHIKLGIYDLEKSEFSREFIKTFNSSEYFDIVKYINNPDDVNHSLDDKSVQCVVTIPADFSEKFYTKEKTDVQFLVDGVNGNTATIIMNYVNAATLGFSQKISADILARAGGSIKMPVNVQGVFWYNPDLKTTEFLIPGLIATILIVICVTLTAVSIVREKEQGTIEQINVSPVSPLELILGKIIPYILLAILISILVLLLGAILFGVQIKGSILYMFIGTLLYLIACLSMGIFVSTIADSMQVAFQLSTLISQLPTNILSGFIFPIESMPWAIQIITNLSPAKFFLVILRSVVIKGTGIETFWQQYVYLAIFALAFLTIAMIRTARQRRTV